MLQNLSCFIYSEANPLKYCPQNYNLSRLFIFLKVARTESGFDIFNWNWFQFQNYYFQKILKFDQVFLGWSQMKSDSKFVPKKLFQREKVLEIKEKNNNFKQLVIT